MFVRSARQSAAIVLVAGGGVFAACTGNPVDPDHTADHADVFGIVLRIDDDTLYAYSAHDGSVSCSESPCGISVDSGAPARSIEVVFLDRLDLPIAAGELAENFELLAVVADTTVTRVSIRTSTSGYLLDVTGRRAGTTRMRLALMHEGEHEDFGTPPIDDNRALQIRVEE